MPPRRDHKMPDTSNFKLPQKFIILALLLFGSITLFMSGSVIFDLFGIREKQGDFVPFIVWTNFICGLLYLLAGWGLLRRFRWTTSVLVLAVMILIFGLAGLMWHISQGGAYELKTVKAMVFRILFTLAFAVFSWRYHTANKSE